MVKYCVIDFFLEGKEVLSEMVSDLYDDIKRAEELRTAYLHSEYGSRPQNVQVIQIDLD